MQYIFVKNKEKIFLYGIDKRNTFCYYDNRMKYTIISFGYDGSKTGGNYR